MFVGILFTVLVSVVIGIISTLTFFTHHHSSSPHEGKGTPYFAVFWLVMAAVWFTAALTDFLYYVGFTDISLFAAYLLQILVGVSLIVLAYFLSAMFLERYWINAVLALYAGLFLIFITLLAAYGFRPIKESFFSNQIILTVPPAIVYLISVTMLWTAVIAYFIWAIRQKHSFSRDLYHFHILAAWSLILLGVSGSIDEMGIIGDWSVTATRLITLVSSMIAFFAITALHEPKELVI